MSEKFLQFLWKHSFYNRRRLVTSDGQKIKVLSPGLQNSDSGPDFFNSKIQIGDTLWAGNVEVHVKASDWSRHNHQVDKAYDNVILHVVYINDGIARRTNGEIVPALCIGFQKSLLKKYEELLNNKQWVPCEKDLEEVGGFTISEWLASLMSERLERKTNEIRQVFNRNINSLEETLYHLLAKNFGQHLNAEPFTLLATSLPLKIILKQKNSLLSTEALLFGQAGMLEEINEADRYYTQLKKEFHFLKSKYKLKPVGSHLWKFLRLRPANFPTIRISQLAVLLFNNQGLFSKIISLNNSRDFEKLFDVSASEYWDTHYIFGKNSKKSRKKFGRASTHLMLINVVAPMMFFYGKEKGNEIYMQLAVELLETLKRENNSIINKWVKTGINPMNACDTQALLELKQEYCDKKNCLDCRIGMKILEKNIGTVS